MHPSSDNYSLNYIDYSYNSPISPSSSLYHIPSPPLHYYEDELLLLQALILQHQQSQPLDEESNNLDTISAVGLVQNESFASGVVQNNRRLDNSIHYKNEGQVAITNNNNNNNNKRASKKDRHSKITTARGARDRRMRLSLDVAREFFDLQDTLGFDKASKTVDWLLTKSSSAIREAAASLGFIINSASPSASECDDDARTKPQGGSTSTVLQEKGKKKKAKQARIIRAPFHALTKESRKKARERARERTMLKKQLGEESGTYQQNKAGILFSQQLPVMVDTRVNKKISGTNQQYNAGIFSKQVEELEQELLSSDLSCIFK